MRLTYLFRLSVLGAVAAAGLALPATAQSKPAAVKLETPAADGEPWPSWMMSPGAKLSFPPKAPYAYPFYFTLPFELGITQKADIKTNTVITDGFKIVPFRDFTGDGVANLDDIPPFQRQYSQALDTWIASVKKCRAQRPNMYRVVGEEKVPVVINGDPGTIFLNANNKPVCPK